MAAHISRSERVYCYCTKCARQHFTVRESHATLLKAVPHEDIINAREQYKLLQAQKKLALRNTRDIKDGNVVKVTKRVMLQHVKVNGYGSISHSAHALLLKHGYSVPAHVNIRKPDPLAQTQASITAPMVDISNNGITEDIIAHLCNTLSHTDSTEVGPDVYIPRWHFDGMTDLPSNGVAGNVDEESDGDSNDFQGTKLMEAFFGPAVPPPGRTAGDTASGGLELSAYQLRLLQPAYDGADQTVIEYCAQFVGGKVKHPGMPGSAVQYYQRMILELLPPDHKVPTTYQGALKAVNAFGPNLRATDVCVNGDSLFTGVSASELFCRECGEARYHTRASPTGSGEMEHLTNLRARKVYLSFSLKELLQGLFRDPEFVRNMSYPHTSFKHIHKDLWHKDLYDGELFQEFMVHYGLANPDGSLHLTSEKWGRTIALSLNHDGVCPFKDSSFSCWVVCCKVLNLPPHMRVKFRNMMVLGIIPGWFKLTVCCGALCRCTQRCGK